jgi:acyl-CoA reductase-like NAD-dependent aldehyde dehydrogenase
MTPEEVREWLGAGLVMPAIKPPPPAQPQDADQAAHDKRMAAQTPEQRAAMVKRLGALARGKLGDLTPEEQP